MSPEGLPSGWVKRPLGEIAREGPRNGYSGNTADNATGTLTLRLSATTSGSCLLSSSTTKRMIETIPENSPFWLFPGDLLVQRSNTIEYVGTAAVFNGPSHTYIYPDLMMRLRFEHPETAFWVASFLNSPMGRIAVRRLAAGSAGSMPKISGAKLRSVRVPLPPLAAQRAIIATLHRAESLQAQRERSLALLDDLLRSAFVEMFGDPATNPNSYNRVPLGHLLAVPPRIGTTRPACDEGRIPVIRVGEIGGDDIDIAHCGRVNLSDSERERYQCHPGDILLARAIGSAGHLGKATVFPDSPERVVFDSHVMRLRTNANRLLGVFLLHWLRSSGGRALFLRQGGRTAVQFNINAKQIAALLINLPPIDLQRRYARLVERADSQRRLMLASQHEASSLTSTLLLRAFRGEL